MRLLFVLGCFFPAELGGPCNSVHAMAQGLARQGAEVTVLSLADGLDEAKRQQYGLRLDAPNSLGNITAWYFSHGRCRYLSPGLYRRLWGLLPTCDMVLLTSYFFPITWAAAAMCAMRGVPFALAPRGELEPGAYRFSAARKSLVRRLFLRRLYDKARFVYVTSGQEEAFSRPFFRARMPFVTLPNCLECQPVGREDMRPSGRRDIVYLGRLHPKKAVERLVSAFAMLPGKLRQAHGLSIVGSGDADYVRSLEKLAAERGVAGRVSFMGHLDGEAKTRILDRGRVLVLPSHSENFGLVVLEALARGMPVIASTRTPWSELETFGCGLWIDNDPDSLAKGLRRILGLDDEEYAAACANALRLVDERYGLETNIGRFMKELRGHVSQGS